MNALCRCLLLLVVGIPSGYGADDLRLESFAYPFPVQMFKLKTQQQELEMAYMDVKPERDASATVVLFHGKKFSGAYWKETAEALRAAGNRVIMPDQVGFGKSTKPAHYQFSFQQLAANTRDLLRSLGVTRAHLVGHSMGGMLAARFALMYADETQSLTLVNPLGLEDWKAQGVPYRPLESLYQGELTQNADKIRTYEREAYYGGDWRPSYDQWVEMLVTFTRSPDYPRMAWIQALTSDMIYTQPVFYELPAIAVPTLLLIGQRDRAAPGKDGATEAVRAKLGNYPALGRAAATRIPNSQLVELQGNGHAPHLENFPEFIEPLRTFLHSHRTRVTDAAASPRGSTPN